MKALCRAYSGKMKKGGVMNQIIYPRKIVKSHLCEGERGLLLKQELQIDLSESNLTRFHDGGYVILDFGKEMCGGIRIITHGSDITPVRIRFGESVAECCSNLGRGEEFSGKTVEREISEHDIRRNSTNDHALRDISVALPSWSDTPIGDTGFRFVRLDFTGEYSIKSIVCTNSILSKRAKYVYRGERPVERIYEAAKRTVDLCASSGYIWDGIKRDRLVWAGDLYPEVLALVTLYGECAEVERSLDFAREHNALPAYMNDFPTYSLWWIIMVNDYLLRTGSEDFVKRQLDYLEGLVKQLSLGVDGDGVLSYKRYFIDWPHADHPNEKDGFRAVSIMAARAAESLLSRYGRDASEAKEYLFKLMKKDVIPTTGVVAALKYFALGKLSYNEQRLLLDDSLHEMSTFMGYFILKAIAAYDREHAWNVMKEFYGAMLSLGSTTFWEDFSIDWAGYERIDRMLKKNKKCPHGDTGKHCYIGFRKSLCHGWSAGVIAFIKEFNEEA